MNGFKKAIAILAIYFVTAMLIAFPFVGMNANKKYWILSIVWVPAGVLVFKVIKKFGQNSLGSIFLLASIIGFSFWFAFGLFESGTLDFMTLAFGVSISIVVGFAFGSMMLLFSYFILKLNKFRQQ